MRIALGVEYDGSSFQGWQTQHARARTVQSTLEKALSQIANHPVKIICAGRTDTGVHAVGQVIHYDTTVVRTPRTWTLGVNSLLPQDIAIQWAREMPETFHARFSATARRYDYLLLNQPQRSALWAQRATWWYKPLDAGKMHAAAQAFIGRHDFSAFRAAACQAHHPVREIRTLSVARRGNVVHLTIVANAFLHHMVRNVLGVLLPIGAGEQPIDWAQAVLASRDRTCAGVTAPAQGLYLTAVEYKGFFPDEKNYFS